MGYAIEVINVSKEFQKPDGGRLKVLENVNLKIEDGSLSQSWAQAVVGSLHY